MILLETAQSTDRLLAYSIRRLQVAIVRSSDGFDKSLLVVESKGSGDGSPQCRGQGTKHGRAFGDEVPKKLNNFNMCKALFCP